ncbi:superoxide dismutase family protein [Piscirickettsia litoralis]|nr:superoxide dismutase family protein [Piscirickettsia litoralis]
MHQVLLLALIVLSFPVTGLAHADSYLTTVKSITFSIYSLEDQDKKYLGTVTTTDTPFGLLLTPKLSYLPNGIHAWHIHQVASCDHQGKAAGKHFHHHQKNTTQHATGPYDPNAPVGDLPSLTVINHHAELPVLAPRLKLADLPGRSIVIHQFGGKYYSSITNKSGGKPIACGTINYNLTQ